MVLVVSLAVQGIATVPLVFLGTNPIALAILIPALFIGFFGHVAAIVAFTITATSGLPDRDQGLATGITSLAQQVGITIGIPILGTLAATQTTLLGGIHIALWVDVVVTLATAGLVWIGLRPHHTRPAPADRPLVNASRCHS